MISETRPWRAALLTVVVCGLIGPFIGLVLTFVGVSFLPFARGFDLLDLIFTRTSIAAAYFYCGFPAVVFGVAMMTYGKLRGEQPLWFVLLVAALLLLCVVQILGVKNSTVISVFGVACIASSLICWLVFRRFWRVMA
jgi:drug/metabolite transporter (DMT)-like permease